MNKIKMLNFRQLRLSFKRNKKGIALAFLVTLVLGITIFGTTAIIFAELFRVSGRARLNFDTLTETINSMSKKSSGEIEAFHLIMDKESIIVFFNKGVNELITQEMVGNQRKFFSMERPLDCDNDKHCACLISDFELNPLTNAFVARSFEIIAKDAYCNNIDMALSYSNTISSTPLLWRSSEMGLKMNLQSRERAVFLERGEGFQFGICIESPCLRIQGNLGTSFVELEEQKYDEFITKLISESYALTKINRSGKSLLQTENKACLCPGTNPIEIEIVHKLMNNGAVEFIWDAKENKAYAKDSNKDTLYDAAALREARKTLDKVFDNVDEDWFYDTVALSILQTTSLDRFAFKITEMINWNDPCLGECLRIVDGTERHNRIKLDFVKDYIIQNRANYLESWVNPMNCKDQEIQYACNLYETKGECILESNGNICLKDSVKKCGETCLCKEDYQPGDQFFFCVGDKEWQFEITPHTAVEKGKTGNLCCGA